jgi:hypothetical protein
MKTKAKSSGYATVLYNNSYWKAYPLGPGSKIFYGDVLSSGAESKMVLTLQDGFRIILAKNTKVRLTPNFIKNNSDSVVETWLYLLNGKIRAYLLSHDDEPKTEFRTRTLAMGVRGTEFVMAVNEGQTKLLTIDGEVFARPVEKQEAERFESASTAFIKQDDQQLAQEVRELQHIEVAKEISLRRGEKIERAELPPAQQTEFASQAAQLSDLKEAREIGENMEQLIQDKKQNDLDSLTDEKSERVSEATPEPQTAIPFQPLLLRVGVGSLSISHPDIEAREGGLSFSLDYLLNRYSFAGIELARGDWSLDSLNNPSGFSPRDIDIKARNSSRYLLSVGGRWPFTQAFSAAVALSYVGSRHLAIQYADQFHLDYRIKSSVLFRCEASYQVWDDWQLFLSFGGGGTKARIKANGSLGNEPADSPMDLNQSYARFGIGRFLGL